MNNLFKDNILKKISIVLIFVIAIVLYLRLSVWYSGITPSEYFSFFIGKSFFEGTQTNILTYFMHSPVPAFLIGLIAKMGIESSTRIVLASFGILSLLFYYKFLMENVFDFRSAIISLILFSLQSSHIFMSKFISNDIIAFTFFIAAIWIGSVFINRNKSYLMLIIASSLYLLAVLSYYPLILFFPVFILILFFIDRISSVIFFGIITSILLVYLLIDFDLITAQLSNFINKQIDFSLIFKNFESNLYYLSAILIIFILVFNNYKRLGISLNKMIIISVLSAIMPLFNLILISNYQSYFNLSYSLIFLITYTGVLFKDYLRMGKSMVIAITVVFITLTIVSFYHVSQFEVMQLKLEKNKIEITK